MCGQNNIVQAPAGNWMRGWFLLFETVHKGDTSVFMPPLKMFCGMMGMISWLNRRPFNLKAFSYVYSVPLSQCHCVDLDVSLKLISWLLLTVDNKSIDVDTHNRGISGVTYLLKEEKTLIQLSLTEVCVYIWYFKSVTYINNKKKNAWKRFSCRNGCLMWKSQKNCVLILLQGRN